MGHTCWECRYIESMGKMCGMVLIVYQTLLLAFIHKIWKWVKAKNPVRKPFNHQIKADRQFTRDSVSRKSGMDYLRHSQGAQLPWISNWIYNQRGFSFFLLLLFTIVYLDQLYSSLVSRFLMFIQSSKSTDLDGVL